VASGRRRLHLGTFHSGACGLWAQLPPLEPGKHSLRLAGSSGDFLVSAVYRLTVEAGPDT
jgi:hypothetical protein